MTIQLTRTPQEKAVMAFHEAQQLILKIQAIKPNMDMLVAHQSDLKFLAQLINECHWIDAPIGRDTTKSISIDIDQLEMFLMDLLDQCQGQIETFNHWFKQCASVSYFDSFGGASVLRKEVDAMTAQVSSIMN